MVSLMHSEGLIRIVADTRTQDGTQAVYGGPYPGGVVYVTAAFIEKIRVACRVSSPPSCAP